ncbi:MAG: hypothetical protein GYA41_01095 [Bacteroidales bacterium]|nr:hypothetical protein [Bacteroidales bacterium]
MKTIKFLMAIFILSIFFVRGANAQPQITETIIPFDGIAFCGQEAVSGTLTIQLKLFSWGNLQEKHHWSLVGESGAHYEGDEVINLHFHFTGGVVQNMNYTDHVFIKKDNIPLGIIRSNYHATWNKGTNEYVVVVDNWVVDCFDK